MLSCNVVVDDVLVGGVGVWFVVVGCDRVL